MAKPKLAFIPAAQGSKFYSVLPSSGVGDFTFTRSGSATRINSQGLIETVGNGVSRLNYPLIDGVVKGCPHHLLEPSRTNYYSYSEPTVNESAASNISYESFIWGLGFTNCVKFGDNSTVRYRYGGIVSASTEYTLSAFVIMDDLSEPIIGGQTSDKDFSLVLGGSVVNPNSSVNMGNNIWRFSVTATTSASPGITNNGIIKYTTQSNKGFRVVGWQLEQGSYPTSYIPTNGSAVTRSAETATGSGNTDTFNDSEGVLMAEISALDSDGRIALNNGTTSRNVRFVYNANPNRIDGVVFNGANQFSYQYDLPTQGSFNKISLKYKPSDFSLWVNGFKVGSLVGSGTTFTEGTLSELDFDAGSNGLVPFYGNIKQLQYFDTALTDSELETLTSWVSFSDMAEGQLYSVE